MRARPRYFMAWLRSQTGRADSIGRLARELEAHERNLNGEAAPDSWIKVKSRITRGIIGGGRELRGVVDSALAEFRTSVCCRTSGRRRARPHWRRPNEPLAPRHSRRR